VPAICALGPYPACADVARLSGYFRTSADHYSAFPSGTSRCGVPVAHIHGTNCILLRPISELLVGLSCFLAGWCLAPAPLTSRHCPTAQPRPLPPPMPLLAPAATLITLLTPPFFVLPLSPPASAAQHVPFPPMAFSSLALAFPEVAAHV